MFSLNYPKKFSYSNKAMKKFIKFILTMKSKLHITQFYMNTYHKLSNCAKNKLNFSKTKLENLFFDVLL